MTYPLIRPQEAHRRMQAGATYLDVRTPEEFTAGHAVGAINIPIFVAGPAGREPNPDFVRAVRERLPAATALVIGCATGGRSGQACQVLQQEGYTNVTNIDGGFVGKNDPMTGERIKGWKEEGLPVESGAGAPEAAAKYCSLKG